MTETDIIVKMMCNQFGYDHPSKPLNTGVIGINVYDKKILQFDREHSATKYYTIETEFKSMDKDYFVQMYLNDGVKMTLVDITENYIPIISINEKEEVEIVKGDA